MAYKSDFQKVVEFNHIFGVKLHTTPQFDIFNTEPNNVEFCLKLIREEIKELNDAIKTEDYIETIDALADIIYVVMGMNARLGTNMDSVFDIIIKTLKSHGSITQLKSWFEENKNKHYTFNGLTDNSLPTNFERVIHYHGFEEVKHSTFKYIENVEFIMLTLDCINNCLAKLEIHAKNDYVKTIKYLGYILYYCYYMSILLNTDMDKVFTIVHDNNMSKSCDSEEEAKMSVQAYLAKPLQIYDSPTYRLAPDNTHWVVYNASDKKILKSCKWLPVDLTIIYKQ
jgi:predicted HAD superfamily Cof-like phosphohydrolase